MHLFLDFESRSELDLTVVGLDNYCSHPSTEILMLAWAFGDDEPVLWSPPADMPAQLLAGLNDPKVVKVAWNASFERTMLAKKRNIWVPYEAWLDVMAWSRHMSLPGKLETVGPILKLPADQLKIERGSELIKLFCEPVVPAREDGLFGPTPAVFRDHTTDPVAWAEFEEYCRQDLRSERTILQKLKAFPLPAQEARIWNLDQKINDIGLPINRAFVDGASAVAERDKAEMAQYLTATTHLENVNSGPQMLAWAKTQGYPFSSIGKAMVNRALAGEGDLTELGRAVLTVRQQYAKTASSKLEAIRNIVSRDGRLRDSFTYGGAARTLRWSAHGFQPHNFPRPSKEVEKNYDRALALLLAGDYEGTKREFSSPIDVVGSCLRSVIEAPPGYHFDVCDLSAIEPRITAVISGCQKLLDVFLTGRDPYLDFGARFYKKPYEKVTHDERQICKPAVLGCCYQLSGGEEVENKDGDLVLTGLLGYAQNMGVEMTHDEAHRAVRFYRAEYEEVVACWYAMERAAIAAIETQQHQVVGSVVFQAFGDKLLRLLLPSGRGLHYIRPEIHETEYTDKYDRERTRKNVTYEGIDSQTKQWVRMTTFGGHFFENCVQAIARDVLANGMLLADERGFVIVGHVHDEIIALTPDDSKLTLDDLRAAMIQQPAWAQDLPLDAAGYSGKNYKKE